MATGEIITMIHIFIDHSNIWGGARGASKLRNPELPDISARISIRNLDRILGGERRGVSTKIVSGGIPPGMEGVWTEYENHGYNTQRLFRDDNWKERGVDHTIIGHMWRLLAKYENVPTRLVLASGDGQRNEFGTSFIEVLQEILQQGRFSNWSVCLAAFDWEYPNDGNIHSPTAQKVKHLIEAKAERAEFKNLFDRYDELVFHKEWTPRKRGSI